MGFFSGVKNMHHRVEAGMLLTQLLDQPNIAKLHRLDSNSLAQSLVIDAWEERLDLFNGEFGQRPYKMIVAASALARGIKENYKGQRDAYILALANIMSELEVNGRLYPLNSLDFQLIEEAEIVLLQAAESLIW